MDKAYKTLLIGQIKTRMKERFPEFMQFKMNKIHAEWDVFSGGLLYRKYLANDRFVWLNWFPGPGVARYFNVYLGWSIGIETMPGPSSHSRDLLSARGPLPGFIGGSLDLEQIEGKNAIGGITIPSPWDQLLLIKAAAPRSIQRESEVKAFCEAEALTKQDREQAVQKALAAVFNRVENQMPSFIDGIERL